MKTKLTALLLCVLLLCALPLAGCDLRNRQNSEDFIPSAPSRQETKAPVIRTEPPTQPPVQTERPGQEDKEPVRVLEEQKGTFEYTLTPIEYSYRVPMMDLPGAQAAGCNQEIDERFGAPVRASLEAMEERKDPEVAEVDFDYWIHNGVLTLWVTRKDVDGTAFEAYYTADAVSGARVSGQELLRAAGVEEGTLQSRLIEALRRRFAAAFGQTWSETDDAYTTALTKTLAGSAMINESYAHLTREGSLVAAAELFSPSGASEWIELTLS